MTDVHLSPPRSLMPLRRHDILQIAGTISALKQRLVRNLRWIFIVFSTASNSSLCVLTSVYRDKNSHAFHPYYHVFYPCSCRISEIKHATSKPASSRAGWGCLRRTLARLFGIVAGGSSPSDAEELCCSGSASGKPRRLLALKLAGQLAS